MTTAPDAAPADLLAHYLNSLHGKAPATAAAYARSLRQFLSWLATRPGCAGPFQSTYLTRTAVETYLDELAEHGASLNSRLRHKAVLSNFATWLAEEQGLLPRHPLRGLALPAGSGYVRGVRSGAALAAAGPGHAPEANGGQGRGPGCRLYRGRVRAHNRRHAAARLRQSSMPRLDRRGGQVAPPPITLYNTSLIVNMVI